MKRFPIALLIALTLLAGAVLALAISVPRTQARALVSAPDPQWGADVQVNPTSTVQLASQINHRMAVNPTNLNNVIASYDSFQGSESPSAYASSTDAGLAWTGGRFTGPWGQQGMSPAGDSNVAFDAHGVGYYTSRL